MKRILLLAGAAVSAALISAAALAAPPQFDKDGKLLAPADRDRWITLGTTFALSYEGDGGTTFNTVRMDPDSYAQYLKTGKYPVGAMLDLEVRKPMKEVAPAKGGQTQGPVVGRSIHIKDEKAGPGTWTFYQINANGSPGAAIPRTQACYSCHEQHAKDDTTFTQFYPSLVEARERAAKP